MIAKVALVGAASSRKSTLAYTLAALMKRNKMSVDLVQEFARQYLSRFGPISTPIEQFAMFIAQRDAEAASEQSYDYVLCDSAAFLSLPYFIFYRQNLHQNTEKYLFLTHLLDDLCTRWAKTYNEIFLLSPAEFIDDGVRNMQTDEERDVLYHMIQSFLDDRSIPYTVVSGDMNEKVISVTKALQKYHLGIDLLANLKDLVMEGGEVQ